MIKKRKSRIFFALLIILIYAMVFFFGCSTNINNGNEPPRSGGGKPEKSFTMEDYTRELGTFEGLSAETEWRILMDYFSLSRDPQRSINDFFIVSYYGTYNGYVVVDLPRGYGIRPVKPPYVVAGIIFPWTFIPAVWNNGQFYSFPELYEAGMLTRDDIESIARHYYPKGSDDSLWRIR